MADEDFLALDKVGSVEVVIDPSAVIASARHEFAASANHAIVEREVLIFAEELLDMSLDDGYAPALRELVVVEHAEHVLIPEVFAFCGSVLVYFLAGQGEVPLVAEVEVVLDYVLAELFQYLFILALVDYTIEVLVFEWDKTHFLDAVYLFGTDRRHRLCLVHSAQVRLLVYDQNPHQQTQTVLAFFFPCVDLVPVLFGRQDSDLGCKPVDFYKGGLLPLGASCLQLSKILTT